MNKQAYLIMAHNQFELLKVLVKQIDYAGNDIFIHVDKKTRNFSENFVNNIAKESNIFVLRDRMNIRWGTFDQTECEMKMIEYALGKGHYSYLHLMSGSDMLLTSGKKVHEYFDAQNNIEFVQFESSKLDRSYKKRVSKYHFFIRKNPSLFVKILHKAIIILQIGVNRCRKTGIEYQKGANWFSITEDFASYLLQNKKLIKKLFSHTLCGDEMFVQTMLINSPYATNIVPYNYCDNYENILYCIDWKRGNPYEYRLTDYEALKNSKMFFARKFNWERDRDIIMKLAALNHE